MMTSMPSGADLGGPDDAAEPGSRLVGEWAVCAIAAAASRFIPVPLLDDAVRLRATQLAVLRTLRASGRRYPSDAVEALYAGADAGLAGTFRETVSYLRSVPRRLLLFPVRKYVALFGAVKGVPTDVMVVLLLARSVQRSLNQGRLADVDPTDEPAKDELAREAVRIRRAFDEALQGMDLRLLSGALADGLSQGRGLTRAAVGFARRTFGRDDVDVAADPALDPGGEVGAGAERVQEVLRRPAIALLLTEFDANLDDALTRQPPG